jgi:hypothetical protein
MTNQNDCQSCGMPLRNDPKGGGTYSDGTKSHTYCSLCYAGGRFLDPGLTVERMKALCAGRLHEMGYPLFVARLMVRNLHKLERWNEGAARPLASGSRSK